MCHYCFRVQESQHEVSKKKKVSTSLMIFIGVPNAGEIVIIIISLVASGTIMST